MIEDLSLFLGDWGVPCSAGGHNFKGLENKPDQLIGFEEADQIAKGHTLTAPTADIVLASVGQGSTVVVNGTSYFVRYPLEGGDGAFTRLALGPT